MKYWQKVKIKSWFYEGMEGELVSPVHNSVMPYIKTPIYNVRIPTLREENKVITEHMDNLELI